MPPPPLVTFAEMKAWIPLAGTAADDQVDLARRSASRIVEEYLGRRLVFRAPAEVSGSANVVASRALQDESIALGSITQPAGARTLIVTIVDADRSMTAVTVTVTGTVGGVAGSTETFTFTQGDLVQYGVRFFTAISAIVVSGTTGTVSGDTLKIGSSAGYVEYHPGLGGTLLGTGSIEFHPGLAIWPSGRAISIGPRLRPLEWPVLSVAEANEDFDHVFGASTKLVEGTDFRASGEWIHRLDGGYPRAWLSAYRAVRLTYTAGYFTAANVPYHIKDVALRLAQRIFQERAREGASSYSDAAGTVTRFGPAMLTEPMRDQIYSERQATFQTGERDFDLEAA